MSKKFWIKNEVLLSVIIPLIFIVFGVFLRWVFGENAYPVDYEVIDSYEWSDIFFAWYAGASIFCIIFNVVVAVIGDMFDFHSQKVWVVYGIISIIISLIGPVCITMMWREESFCTPVMYLAFILEYTFTFIISTKNAPRHWDFCPF